MEQSTIDKVKEAKKKKGHSLMEEFCPDEFKHHIVYQDRSEEKRCRIKNEKQHKDIEEEDHLWEFTKRKEYNYIIYKILKSISDSPNKQMNVTKLMKIVGLSNCQKKYYTTVLTKFGLLVMDVIRLDTSTRICVICNNGTYIGHDGRAYWYQCEDGGFLCRKCYQQRPTMITNKNKIIGKKVLYIITDRGELFIKKYIKLSEFFEYDGLNLFGEGGKMVWELNK